MFIVSVIIVGEFVQFKKRWVLSNYWFPFLYQVLVKVFYAVVEINKK